MQHDFFCLSYVVVVVVVPWSHSRAAARAIILVFAPLSKGGPLPSSKRKRKEEEVPFKEVREEKKSCDLQFRHGL